jgi:hypothetical protein
MQNTLSLWPIIQANHDRDNVGVLSKFLSPLFYDGWRTVCALVIVDWNLEWENLVDLYLEGLLKVL